MAELPEEQKLELVASNPHTPNRNAFRYDPATRSIVVDDAEAYAYDGEIEEKARELGRPGLVTITPRPDEFLFRIEGTGALRVRDVILGAVGVLQEKLDVVDRALREAELPPGFGGDMMMNGGGGVPMY
jgi:DNA-directed RNA polymerase II subunit RPB3